MTDWALIVGPKRSGKSSLATRVARELGGLGISVGGVIQEAIHEGEERVGYRARRIGDASDGIVLARHGVAPAGTRSESAREFCSFVFDDDAFARVREWVRGAVGSSEVVLIDEVSKLEVARGGHHDAIVDALGGGTLVILVVRADQLFGVVERFGLDDAVATLEAGDDGELTGFVNAVASAARRGATS